MMETREHRSSVCATAKSEIDRALAVLLLLGCFCCCPQPGLAAGAVTVTTCAALASAITHLSSPVTIPAGTRVDVSQCGGMPDITGPISIRGGAGGAAPVLTGAGMTRIFIFAKSASGNPYNFTLTNLVLANGIASWDGGCVLTKGDSGANGVIQGVTFANCNSKGGGAVAMHGDSVSNALTIVGCIFLNNSAFGPTAILGGALASFGPAQLLLSISNCTFVGNRVVALASGVYGGGGAVYSDGDIYIQGSQFTGNTVTADSGAGGGALLQGTLYRRTGSVSAYKTVFAQNTVLSQTAGGGSFGGAIGGHTVTLSACTLAGNNVTAPLRYGTGGAVYAGSAVLATNTAFTNNYNSGGGIKEGTFGGAVTIWTGNINSIVPSNFSSCSFTANIACGPSAYGGAIVTTWSLIATNCTFTKNAAISSAGGALTPSTGDAQGGAYFVAAVYISTGLMVETHLCKFIGNWVQGTTRVGGGAVATELQLSDLFSVYSNNSATLQPTLCSNSCPAAAYGGALWMISGNLTVQGSSFTYNTVTGVPADGAGGAIAVSSGNSLVAIVSSSFTGNTANSGCSKGCLYQNGGGGAIWSNYQLAVQGSNFTGNTALSQGISNYATGGAILSTAPYQGYTTLKGSTFTLNNATSLTSGQANGGAVSVGVSDLSQQSAMLSCTFANNTASGDFSGGGAVSVNQGLLNISSSSFSFNSVSSGATQAYGGAVDSHLSPDPVTVLSSSFVSNSATSLPAGIAMGGALYFGSATNTINGSLNVIASSFTQNLAVSDSAQGGAILIGQGTSNLTAALSYTSFDGCSAVGSGVTGGAVSVVPGAVLGFCRGNTFGKAQKNVIRTPTSLGVNDLDAVGTPVKFCPSVPVYSDNISNFIALLDCSSCDCGLFNPCDRYASCQMSGTNVPFCRCPTGTRGNGFNCGPVLICV